MIYDVVVIGGGPAGLAAAIKAHEEGGKVLILEQAEYLGGILQQCIHPGFGIHYLGEDLTGPEFASLFIEKVRSLNIPYILSAHVMKIEIMLPLAKKIQLIAPKGTKDIETKAIVYTAGAREKHGFEIGITGDRVSGIYTAGEAQSLMDLYGVMPGKRVLIVGSGDVGLIMARRLSLEGARVVGVVELMPYPGGLARNLVILRDFNIPLYLSHRVLEVHGRGRVERVKMARVNSKGKTIPGTERWIECDTLLISAGLVPEVRVLESLDIKIDPSTGGPVVNEFLETTAPGVFVAGNSLVINDLVDYAVEQGERAGMQALRYAKNGGLPSMNWIPVEKGGNVRCVIPHYINGENEVILYLRARKPVKDATLVTGKKMHKIPVVTPAEMLRVKIKKEDITRPFKVEVSP